ncbi:hypothetical protein BDW68DRAFT_171945 [Aspergillus falconensis]
MSVLTSHIYGLRIPGVSKLLEYSIEMCQQRAECAYKGLTARYQLLAGLACLCLLLAAADEPSCHSDNREHILRVGETGDRGGRSWWRKYWRFRCSGKEGAVTPCSNAVLFDVIGLWEEGEDSVCECGCVDQYSVFLPGEEPTIAKTSLEQLWY